MTRILRFSNTSGYISGRYDARDSENTRPAAPREVSIYPYGKCGEGGVTRRRSARRELQ